jgi:hypothetical protein
MLLMNYKLLFVADELQIPFFLLFFGSMNKGLQFTILCEGL